MLKASSVVASGASPKGLSDLALKIMRGRSASPTKCSSPHSSAALCEIRERARKADFILEVRDARIPLSSKNEALRELGTSTNHFIVLNKMDLANPSLVNTWSAYYQLHEQWHVFVNAHKKDSVKEMLKAIKDPIHKMLKQEKSMLGIVVGVPNIGKSALINALQLSAGSGRPVKEILKKAEVGPLPGVTQKISSYMIDGFPKMYLLDTPGVLPPQIDDAEKALKLSIIGVLDDAYIGEEQLARYVLAFLNVNNHSSLHAKWIAEAELKGLLNASGVSLKSKKRREDPDSKFEVRGIIASTRMSFGGSLVNEEEIECLVDAQIRELRRTFLIPEGAEDWKKVAKRILNLYRTGKLGPCTWDSVPV